MNRFHWGTTLLSFQETLFSRVQGGYNLLLLTSFIFTPFTKLVTGCPALKFRRRGVPSVVARYMFGNGGNPTDGILEDLSNIGHLQECGDLFLQPWLWMDDHPRGKEIVRIIPLFFGHGVKGGPFGRGPTVSAGPTLVDPNHRFMKKLEFFDSVILYGWYHGIYPEALNLDLWDVGEFFSFYRSKSPFFTTIWEKIFGFWIEDANVRK